MRFLFFFISASLLCTFAIAEECGMDPVSVQKIKGSDDLLVEIRLESASQLRTLLSYGKIPVHENSAGDFVILGKQIACYAEKCSLRGTEIHASVCRFRVDRAGNTSTPGTHIKLPNKMAGKCALSLVPADPHLGRTHLSLRLTVEGSAASELHQHLRASLQNSNSPFLFSSPQRLHLVVNSDGSLSQ